MDFLNFEGQNLEATVVWMGREKIVRAVVSADRQDASTAEVYAQQKIGILPGLKQKLEV